LLVTQNPSIEVCLVAMVTEASAVDAAEDKQDDQPAAPSVLPDGQATGQFPVSRCVPLAAVPDSGPRRCVNIPDPDRHVIAGRVAGVAGCTVPL
jgi:hypothetical protein